jgi:DNA-binding NtrC family response regulator
MCKLSRRVLVVDDQLGWREAISSVLEEIDCLVQSSASSREAKALIQSQNFDLAIIDIRLAIQDGYNVDGIDLLQWIYEEELDLPVIILTGYATPALEQKANWYGAVAFTEKFRDEADFDRAGFLQKVREALGIQ